MLTKALCEVNSIYFVKKGREGGREGTSTCVDYVGPAHGVSKSLEKNRAGKKV